MLSLEQAQEIVRLRTLSDIAFFHKLGSLDLPNTFSVNYSLEELRRAEDYDPNQIEIEYSPLIKILKNFREQKGNNKRILDYGAGIGNLARYLKEEGYEIETADNQPISVAAARDIHRLTAHLITAPENITRDLQNRKYELIMLNRVLEQPVMDEETASHLVHSLVPQLEDKGYFLASTSTGILPIDEFQKYFRKVEKVDIKPTNTVRKIYRIGP